MGQHIEGDVRSAAGLAYEELEGMESGWFRELLDAAIQGGGVVWSSPRLFFLGVPEIGREGVLVILYTRGDMGGLMDLALTVMRMGYRSVRWQRVIKGDSRWRELDLERLMSFKRFSR